MVCTYVADLCKVILRPQSARDKTRVLHAKLQTSRVSTRKGSVMKQEAVNRLILNFMAAAYYVAEFLKFYNYLLVPVKFEKKNPEFNCKISILKRSRTFLKIRLQVYTNKKHYFVRLTKLSKYIKYNDYK